VRIRLADDGRLPRFCAADDGAGFLSHRAAGGSALTNMQHRPGAAGGRVWIDSSLGRGAVVHGQIPMSGTKVTG
jgi:signal transduction histidine kinase